MILSYNNKRLYIIMSMKKTLILAAAMLGMSAASMAQSQINTYSVYDVNRTGETTVTDAAMVVQRAVEAIREDPQVVDAAQLNAILVSIDARLQKLESVEARLAAIEEKLGIETPGDPEPEPEEPVVYPFNGHDYIDLGMVINGKKVVWATCNIGAENPEDGGSYFAWGETKDHSVNSTDVYDYNWANYKFVQDGQSTSNYITKYTMDDSQRTGIWYDGLTFVGDSKKVLDLEDDAAHVNWKGDWRMPTRAEFDWLLNSDNCTWTWDSTKKGYLVTSKSTSQSIFLPNAGGCKNYSSPSNVGSYGAYWSSSLGNTTTGTDYASGLSVDKTGKGYYADQRCYGYPIRPVCVVAE